MGVDPTTSCLASIEKEKPDSEAKLLYPSYLLVISQFSTVYKIENARPERSLKIPQML